MMKYSNLLLITLFVMITISLVASNYLLKLEYEKIDKTDPYWNFSTILEKPFKHLKIKGGQNTYASFEQSKNSFVKLINWSDPELKTITAEVKNDTLFLNFPDTFYNHDGMKNYYINKNPLVIVSAPELLSVSGNNCNFMLAKMKQDNYQINLFGNSSLYLESGSQKIKQLNIEASDSSHFSLLNVKDQKKTISIETCNANLQDAAQSDLAIANINQLNLHVGNNAAISLSGYNLNNFISASKK